MIMDEIEKELEKGQTDKYKIYTNVCQLLQVPRPSVRRSGGTLKIILQRKVMILSDDPRISQETKKKLQTLDFKTK